MCTQTVGVPRKQDRYWIAYIERLTGIWLMRLQQTICERIDPDPYAQYSKPVICACSRNESFYSMQAQISGLVYCA